MALSSDRESRPRLLAYRALGLGDFLTGVPAYRALARAFPAYDVVLAAPEVLRPLTGLTGAVSELLPTAELAPPRWRGSPPDIAVNLHGRGPQSTRLLAAMRPGRLLAFGCSAAGTDGPRWTADEHEVTRWCRLLAESGIPADPTELQLARPPVPPPVPWATVVHPGAADPARRWPAERFADVASSLSAAGHTVVVTGGPAEVDLARDVARRAGLPDEHVLAGTLDLGRLAALLSAARLLICGDTGVAHLATAYRTPSVLIFGPMPPALWGPPPGRTEHRVVWAGRVDGEAGAGPHPSLLAVDVDAVLEAVGSVAGPTPRAAADPPVERRDEVGEGDRVRVR